MQLRPYQQDAVRDLNGAFLEVDRTLAVCPTGSGKTVIFSHLAAERASWGVRTLILAHREELIDQAVDKLHRATGIRAEVEKAERNASPKASVVVASVQTLCREERLNRWRGDHFGLVIVDEAHHALADTYRRVMARFEQHAKILGVTATPDRGDKRNLGEYFQSVGYEIGLIELIKQGYLSPITIRSVPLEIKLDGVRSTAGDFNEADLGHAIEPYLGAIAAAIKEHASNRRTLVFVPLIQTSHKFVTECAKAGLKAVHIDGKSPNRAELIRRFSAWEFDVCSNAMLLTEGFDDAGIDCVVVLRPTRSRSLYAQIVGRGTRIDALKENLLLLDFLWMHEKHSICRPAHLIAGSEEEAEAITAIAAERSAGGATQEDLELGELATAATHEREIALRKKLEAQKGRRKTVITAEEFAVQHNRLAIAEYQPTMPWESQPISEKQAWHLKRAKIDMDTVKGRGHASLLLDVIMHQKAVTPASPKAVALMRRMAHVCHAIGISDLSNPTEQEAGRFFGELNRRKRGEAVAV